MNNLKTQYKKKDSKKNTIENKTFLLKSSSLLSTDDLKEDRNGNGIDLHLQVEGGIGNECGDSNECGDGNENGNRDDGNETIKNNEEIMVDDNTLKKKRGRKPKGGKIVSSSNKEEIVKEIVKPRNNIVLHLKCSFKEIVNTNCFSEISYLDLSRNSLEYQPIEINNNMNNDYFTHNDINFNEKYCLTIKENENNIFNNNPNNNSNNNSNNNNNGLIETYNKNCNEDIKEICKKLKKLENMLHTNNTNDKKSACFWCTYDFNTPSIHIPKFYVNEMYNVYGCFCSPECATAFLMKENIDNSTKFERYQLLNHIYSEVYKYNKNIKPAPNPYYLLDKYCGNLNIQEYRSLLQNERLFLVVDKPLTLVMTELFDCNDEFVLNKKIIPNNNSYSIKKNPSSKKGNNSIFDEIMLEQ